jgi:hypothetical protein
VWRDLLVSVLALGISAVAVAVAAVLDGKVVAVSDGEGSFGAISAFMRPCGRNSPAAKSPASAN